MTERALVVNRKAIEASAWLAVALVDDGIRVRPDPRRCL